MSINLFADSETHYTVVFNKALSQKGLKKKKRKDGDSDIEDGADGPIIERRCPKCGHERMSYAALQLRLVQFTDLPPPPHAKRFVGELGSSTKTNVKKRECRIH